MFKWKLNTGDIFLILVNLVPLAGVWFLQWEATQMFLIYCVETIIIGIYNVIKMTVAGIYKRRDVWNENPRNVQPFWFFILFFIIHYGFFVFIQTNIFASVSGISKTGMGFSFFQELPILLTDYSKLVLYIFIAMYGVKTFSDFIFTGAYKTSSLAYLMFYPYARIFVQQFVVIAGSIFLTFGAGKIFMLIFVAVKIFAEIFLNLEKLLLLAEKKSKEKALKNREL